MPAEFLVSDKEKTRPRSLGEDPEEATVRSRDELNLHVDFELPASFACDFPPSQFSLPLGTPAS